MKNLLNYISNFCLTYTNYISIFINMIIHPLKKYSLEVKISIRKIAKDIDISSAQLYYITNYKGIPSPKLAKKIEEYTKGEVRAIDLLFPFNKE